VHHGSSLYSTITTTYCGELIAVRDTRRWL
jgi:hypothetical protein